MARSSASVTEIGLELVIRRGRMAGLDFIIDDSPAQDLNETLVGPAPEGGLITENDAAASTPSRAHESVFAAITERMARRTDIGNSTVVIMQMRMPLTAPAENSKRDHRARVRAGRR
jgi:hypothetical protein